MSGNVPGEESTMPSPSEARRLARSRARWNFIGKANFRASMTLAAIAIIVGGSGTVLALINSPLYDTLQPLFPTSLIFSTMAIIGSVMIGKIRKKEQSIVVDERFHPKDYDLLVSNLKTLGVKDPVGYIVSSDKHIAAFKRVCDIIRFRVDPHPSYKGNRSNLQDYKLAMAQKQGEYRIAALVLPGEEELAREDEIIGLVITRGLKQYSQIKAALNENKAHPTPLHGGNL